MIKELVLRINLEHLEEKSRKIQGKQYITRAVNCGVLSEDDIAFFLDDDENILVKVESDEDSDSTS